LRIDYVLSNPGSTGIFFDAYPDDGEREAFMEGKAFLSLSADATRLHVSLTAPPPPDDADYYRPVISLARWVPGSGEFRGEIHCPIPVQEWSPYADPGHEGAEGEEEVQVAEIALSTAWFADDHALWREDGPVPGTYWTEGRPTYPIQVLLRMDTPIPVLRRLDELARF
jgi:hypothetical protein